MKLAQKGEQVIAWMGKDGYRNYRIPGLLPTADGALLLALEARRNQGGDWGNIDIFIYRREADGSMTRTLLIGDPDDPDQDHPLTYNNPVLIPDGETVHLIYHLNYEKAFICTSSDCGRTWGASREITHFFRQFDYDWNVCATGPGHGIQLENGRLVAPIWLANGKLSEDGLTREHAPSFAGCIYSDDHGLTWQAGPLMRLLTDSNETCAVPLPGSRVLFNFRTPNRLRFLSESPDGAESFGPVQAANDLPDPRCFGGMCRWGEKILFTNCNTPWTRTNITVKQSLDEGRTWEPIWSVDASGGYSDIAAIGDTVFVFTEREFQYPDAIRNQLVLKWAEPEA